MGGDFTLGGIDLPVFDQLDGFGGLTISNSDITTKGDLANLMVR